MPMALIQCPECHHNVSTLAPACLHCGCPIFRSLSAKDNMTGASAGSLDQSAPSEEKKVSDSMGVSRQLGGKSALKEATRPASEDRVILAPPVKDGMRSMPIRQKCLYSVGAFMIIVALITIFCVLFGFAEPFDGRVLATLSVMMVSCACSLGCIGYLNRAVGPVPSICGLILVFLAAILLLLGVWTQTQSEAYWKATGILCIFAIASGYSFGLLVVPLRIAHRWIPLATVASVLVLSVVVSVMIVLDIKRTDTDPWFRVLAVVGMLAGLGSLLVGIMAAFHKTESLSTQAISGTPPSSRDDLHEKNDLHTS
jgi:hypothetical protein